MKSEDKRNEQKKMTNRQFSLRGPVLRIPGVRLGEAVPRLPALGEGVGLGVVARLGKVRVRVRV